MKRLADIKRAEPGERPTRELGPAAFPSILTDLLRAKIAALGTNPTKVSEALGINKGLVHRVAMGRQGIPVKQVEAWAKALAIEDASELAVAVMADKARRKAGGKPYVLMLEGRVAHLEREVKRQSAVIAQLRARRQA